MCESLDLMKFSIVFFMKEALSSKFLDDSSVPFAIAALGKAILFMISLVSLIMTASRFLPFDGDLFSITSAISTIYEFRKRCMNCFVSFCFVLGKSWEREKKSVSSEIRSLKSDSGSIGLLKISIVLVRESVSSGDTKPKCMAAAVIEEGLSARQADFMAIFIFFKVSSVTAMRQATSSLAFIIFVEFDESKTACSLPHCSYRRDFEKNEYRHKIRLSC